MAKIKIIEFIGDQPLMAGALNAEHAEPTSERAIEALAAGKVEDCANILLVLDELKGPALKALAYALNNKLRPSSEVDQWKLTWSRGMRGKRSLTPEQQLSIGLQVVRLVAKGTKVEAVISSMMVRVGLGRSTIYKFYEAAKAKKSI